MNDIDLHTSSSGISLSGMLEERDVPAKAQKKTGKVRTPGGSSFPRGEAAQRLSVHIGDYMQVTVEPIPAHSTRVPFGREQNDCELA